MTDKVKPQSLSVKSGDTLKLPITVKDSAGVVKDLTGASAIFTIARAVLSAALITKTDGSGITFTDPINGLLDVLIDAADSDALDGTFYFECEVTDQAGDKATVAFGFITYNADQIT